MTHPISYCLTLVLNKRDSQQFSQMMGLVPGAHKIEILSDHKSVDFYVDLDAPASFKTNIQNELNTHNITADMCLQGAQNRKKKLLICDMDSTLIGQECIDELADFAGVKDRVSQITERAMRGDIDFEGALKERVILLNNLDLSVLQTCFDTRIHLNDGARTLCQTMKAHGAKTAIVSGGFTFFTERIAKLCGFDTHQANILLEDAGALTGEVALPILGRSAKLDALKYHSQELGGAQNALAIGDGANDLAMITGAGLGIAYYAKPAVAQAAHCAINHTDLTTALYYQGYHDHDFIT